MRNGCEQIVGKNGDDGQHKARQKQHWVQLAEHGGGADAIENPADKHQSAAKKIIAVGVHIRGQKIKIIGVVLFPEGLHGPMQHGVDDIVLGLQFDGCHVGKLGAGVQVIHQEQAQAGAHRQKNGEQHPGKVPCLGLVENDRAVIDLRGRNAGLRKEQKADAEVQNALLGFVFHST